MSKGKLKKVALVTSTAIALAGLVGCAATALVETSPNETPQEKTIGSLEQVVALDGPIPTGVTVSAKDRIFVNFPRWGDQVDFTVAEIKDGRPVPYPNANLNRDDKPQSKRLVSVQSVVVDPLDRLWLLDTGSIKEGVTSYGGPKLVGIDLATNQVVVRVDADREIAFITESGTGAFIVVDLKTGKSMRRLAAHSSTKGDPKLTMMFPDGRKWMFTAGPNKGQKPNAPLDGLALDTENGYIYYQALSNNKLYRIPTAVLSNMKLPEAEVEKSVEFMGKTVFSDGMEADDRGNVYFTAVEKNAIVVWSPGGKLTTLVQNPVVSWPDGFARHNGDLYFSVAQIHRTAVHSADNSNPNTPYRVMKTKQLGQ